MIIKNFISNHLVIHFQFSLIHSLNFSFFSLYLCRDTDISYQALFMKLGELQETFIILIVTPSHMSTN